MATVAEMRARLAKYAVPKPTIVEVKDEPERVTSIPSPPIQETVELSTGPIVTELQPTTLVVVERVLDSPSEASSDLESSDTGTRLDRSNPVHANFLQRLSDLEAALLIRDPLMRTHLGEIHKAMINYEEIPSLLTVDEISKIMAAQQVQTNTVLVASISKAAASKKAPKVTLDDI